VGGRFAAGLLGLGHELLGGGLVPIGLGRTNAVRGRSGTSGSGPSEKGEGDGEGGDDPSTISCQSRSCIGPPHPATVSTSPPFPSPPCPHPPHPSTPYI